MIEVTFTKEEREILMKLLPLKIYNDLIAMEENSKCFAEACKSANYSVTINK